MTSAVDVLPSCIALTSTMSMLSCLPKKAKYVDLWMKKDVMVDPHLTAACSLSRNRHGVSRL